MPLPKYTPERRREIAGELGVDEQYIYQVCSGLRTASPALARRFNALDSAARLQELRPDDWATIWPELIGSPGAPEVPAVAGQEAA